MPLAVPADRFGVPADAADAPAPAPATVGATQAAHAPSRAVIERLQAKIRTIEASRGATPHDLLRGVPDTSATPPIAEVGDVLPRRARQHRPWSLGAVEIDARLGATGLDPRAIHEIKPGPAIGDWAAAAGFIMRLAIRRLHAAGGSPTRRILWCATDRMTRELGFPHGAGLLRMGLDPGVVILVEAGRTADLLWAMEEGLKSRSLSLAVGIADIVGPVPARRLSLAAKAGATPALLLTHPAHAAAAATATRWRIFAQPCAPHPLDPRAPGAARFGIELERCRTHPLALQTWSHIVEWSDETLHFRVAAGMADRARPPPTASGVDTRGRRSRRTPRSEVNAAPGRATG